MGKEYSQPQKQAICDALTVLVENLAGHDLDVMTWLKACMPGKLSRCMHVDVTWDEDHEKFIYY